MSQRFEETPELFGNGMGTGTLGEALCEFCGTVHNEGCGIEDAEGHETRLSDYSVRTTDFAGKQICECCFHKIEREILSRLPDIIPWYRRFLARQRIRLEAQEALVSSVIDEEEAGQ